MKIKQVGVVDCARLPSKPGATIAQVSALFGDQAGAYAVQPVARKRGQLRLMRKARPAKPPGAQAAARHQLHRAPAFVDPATTISVLHASPPTTTSDELYTGSHSAAPAHTIPKEQGLLYELRTYSA